MNIDVSENGNKKYKVLNCILIIQLVNILRFEKLYSIPSVPLKMKRFHFKVVQLKMTHTLQTHYTTARAHTLHTRAVKSCGLGRYRVNQLSTQPNPTLNHRVLIVSQPNGFVRVIVYPKKNHFSIIDSKLPWHDTITTKTWCYYTI